MFSSIYLWYYSEKKLNLFILYIFIAYNITLETLYASTQAFRDFTGETSFKKIAYNLTAIAATAILLGIDRDEVLVQLSQLHAADGRFQTLHAPKGFTAIVDYAHTPDALINVLDTIRDLVRGKGQIIAVCGCGGDRDATKRPIMAHAAATRSDRTILTSDNPRTEDPEAILRDMEAGLTDDDRQHTIKITDRREAIRTACLLAQPGDVVLVAGKGHETYQDVMGVKHHFDDREVLRECFN